MEKQIRHGLVGLLGAALLSGCRVCPSGYTEEQENVCVKEEKRKEVLGNYTFDELYSLTTSLVTTFDAPEACAGFSNASVNGEQSSYDECTRAYSQFQSQLPVFSLENTSVNTQVGTLQVYTWGYSGYYTGSAVSVTFKDVENMRFLSGTAFILDEGCAYNLDHYYRSFVCSSSTYKESEESNDMSLGCRMTLDFLDLHPASSFCGFEDFITIKSGSQEFAADQLNEDLLLLHYDYARALEELVLSGEGE